MGEVYTSCAALCRRIGIKATTGKQRKIEKDILQQYFSWEEQAHSNQLVITETYYDNPRQRKTKERGRPKDQLRLMMQNLIASSKWNGSNYYSKWNILIMLGLLPREKDKNNQGDKKRIFEKAQQEYINCTYDLLKRAMDFLGKSEGNQVEKHIFFQCSGKMLTAGQEVIYKQIRRDALSEVSEKNLNRVYASNKDKEYWAIVNDRCISELGDSCVSKWKISISAPCERNVKREELVDGIISKLVDQNGGLPAIGKNSVTDYRDGLLRLKENIMGRRD